MFVLAALPVLATLGAVAWGRPAADGSTIYVPVVLTSSPSARLYLPVVLTSSPRITGLPSCLIVTEPGRFTL
jgi:hypothetical protein